MKKKHKLHLSGLFCCNHTCYCVNMVSVTSGSSYVTSASHYHPCYQSRCWMYICGLIPRNSAELVAPVLIGTSWFKQFISNQYIQYNTFFNHTNIQIRTEARAYQVLLFRYKLSCAYSRDSNQSAHPQSDQS